MHTGFPLLQLYCFALWSGSGLPSKRQTNKNATTTERNPAIHNGIFLSRPLPLRALSHSHPRTLLCANGRNRSAFFLHKPTQRKRNFSDNSPAERSALCRVIFVQKSAKRVATFVIANLWCNIKPRHPGSEINGPLATLPSRPTFGGKVCAFSGATFPDDHRLPPESR